MALRIARGLLGFVLMLVLVLAAIGAMYDPDIEIPKGFPGHHVQVAGVPLRVVQRGIGPDILLIHGSPGCIEDWNPVIDALASNCRVTAYDRPGHGFSGDTGAYSLEYNARIAAAVIAKLELKNPIVVGHSYGGATTLALAVRAPAQVAGYVIVDSGAYTPVRPPEALYALLAPPVVGMGFATLIGQRLAPARVRAGLLQIFAPRTPPAGFVDLRVSMFSTPKVVHALAMESRGAAGWLAAQSPYYPAIRKPMHIVAQAGDAFRRTTAQHLQRDVPGASLELLPNTGHYVQFEKTAEVVAAIRATAARAQ